MGTTAGNNRITGRFYLNKNVITVTASNKSYPGNYDINDFAGPGAAIQAAVDDLSSSGGTVVLYPGTYTLEQDVVIKPNSRVHIDASGPRTILDGNGYSILLGMSDDVIAGNGMWVQSDGITPTIRMGGWDGKIASSTFNARRGEISASGKACVAGVNGNVKTFDIPTASGDLYDAGTTYMASVIGNTNGDNLQSVSSNSNFPAYWVAVGEGGSGGFSIDGGVTWADIAFTSGHAAVLPNEFFRDVDWNAGSGTIGNVQTRVVAVATNGTILYQSVTNNDPLLAWGTGTWNVGVTEALFGVKAERGIVSPASSTVWVTVGTNSLIGTSVNNAANWTDYTANVPGTVSGTETFRSVAHDGTTWVVVGGTTSGVVVTAADPTSTWTDYSDSSMQPLWDVQYVADIGAFVAVGENGTMYWSTDSGATWRKDITVIERAGATSDIFGTFFKEAGLNKHGKDRKPGDTSPVAGWTNNADGILITSAVSDGVDNGFVYKVFRQRLKDCYFNNSTVDIVRPLSLTHIIDGNISNAANSEL